MLHLDKIAKTYRTGSFTQAALDEVTITLRDNEFVAILGPSGSGKTTMLNIVGGLDHYDSGDLVIDGVSTSQYTDRDWDAYRNNRIGFVFQSYNLIPHQTVLANVELALTLSGVGPAERAQRAKKALARVDLADHINKLPSQLSGGQMQRVAIARALINDPEILLADEPTGALDSKTSVHVMNLLQQIAQDRLVVLVTHNAELADQYATRIVSLKDGQIVSDTNPYSAESEQREAKPVRRTSMSFLTAIALSFTNLMTKKGRTLMTSFAGSIGIIGIALILALANGVNAYIRSVEEDTLSLYPLSIQSQGFDLTSMLTGASGDPSSEPSSSRSGDAHEIKMMTRMFSRVGSNDLASLKTYLDSSQSGVDRYAKAVQYNYGITPQIFANSTKVRQVNPNSVFAALGMGANSSASSMMGMSTNVFAALPDDQDLINGQYNILAGHWPTRYDECLLVLTGSGGVSDFILYAMGLRDPVQLDQMVQQLANGQPIKLPTDTLDFSYQQLMNVSFRVVDPTAFYQYDPTYRIWTDRRKDESWMAGVVADGLPLRIVGVAQPDPSASANMLRPGLYYTPDLVHRLMTEAADSPIVTQQRSTPTVNVFSGKTFAEEAANPSLSNFDFSSLITVDQDAVTRMMAGYGEGFSFPALDLATMMNGDDLATTLTSAAAQSIDLTELFAAMNIQISAQALAEIMSQTLGDYLREVYGVSGNSPAPTTPPPTTATPASTRPSGTSTAPTSTPPSTTGSPSVGGATMTVPSSAPTSSQNPTAPTSTAPTNTVPTTLPTTTVPTTAPTTTVPTTAPTTTVPTTAPTTDQPTPSDAVSTKDPTETTSPTPPITPGEAAAAIVLFPRLAPLTGSLPTSTSTRNMIVFPTLPGATETTTSSPTVPTAPTSTATTPTSTATVPTTTPSISLPSQWPSNLPTGIPGMPGVPNPDQFTMSFIEWFSTPEAQARFNQRLLQAVGSASIDQQAVNDVMGRQMQQILNAFTATLQQQLTMAMSAQMGALSAQMSSAMAIDPEQFREIFSFNMDPNQLTGLLMSMAGSQTNSLEYNLRTLGYADKAIPSSIDIYPTDFAAKQHILDILNNYNSRMAAAGHDDKVITFTDIFGIMMASVQDIINKISAVLVGFVSISLVVSSIMIGIITYISVLERKKEIGILRALGASKRDIGNVFNAETLIVGFVAGLMGVLISLVLTIIANPIIYALTDAERLAQLPLVAAVALIVVSMLLTFVAGLIPSSAASRRDPVEALRSE